MHSTTTHPRLRPPPGEPFVWLCSLGLSAGLLMVVVVLAVIAYQGFFAFWPRRICELTLAATDPAMLNGAQKIGGEIVKKQTRAATSPATGGPPGIEWQLFVGNRDWYGSSFIFVDLKQIAKIEYPRDLVRIERDEYGNALGYPVRLQLKDQVPILYEENHERFTRTLARQRDEIRDRRLQIRQIEKVEIGKINARLEAIRLRLRRWEKAGQTGPAAAPAEIEALTAEQARLRADYELLATRAAALRQQQEEHQLTYRLVSGEERTMPLGRLINFDFPNRHSTIERLELVVERVWSFVTEDPREANTEGGIFPAIFGTFVMTVIMSFLVSPFGILAAIYLHEYAKQGFFVRVVRVAVNNLAGVPSIVFGVFGFGFFVYFVGGAIDRLFFADALPTPTFGTGGILWASMTLALMTVPVVIVATEEGLAAVPRGMREGGLACGASKWQCIQRIVLPAAAPGILTGIILAMARGAGEVAPLMLVGVVKLAPTLPINAVSPFVHLDQKFMHLGFHIYDLGFQSPDSEATKPMVFATTFLLIVLVVVMNMAAIVVRERLRRKYALSLC